MSITITIPSNIADRIPAARNYLENVAKREPQWNGAVFAIEEGDCYSIDDDSVDAQVLYKELGASIGIFPYDE